MECGDCLGARMPEALWPNKATAYFPENIAGCSETGWEAGSVVQYLWK